MRQQKGFTLIELLVAMSILALLAITGYKAMQTALSIRQDIDSRSTLLREFELGLYLLSQDLAQIHVSPLPKGEFPFVSTGTDNNLFSFYRAADAEMLSGISLLKYQFIGNALIQQQQIDGKYYDTPIMSNLQSVKVEFHDKDNKSYRLWSDKNQLPDLVTIKMVHGRYGELVFKQEILQ